MLDNSLSMERLAETSCNGEEEDDKSVKDEDKENKDKDKDKDKDKEEDSCSSAGASASSSSLLDLAKHGLCILLDHIELNLRLEQVAYLTFSSGHTGTGLSREFSRDMNSIRANLKTCTGHGGTLLSPALATGVDMVAESWGVQTQTQTQTGGGGGGGGGPIVNVVLVSDGCLGHGPHSLQPGPPSGGSALDQIRPLPFRAKVTVVLLGDPDLVDLSSAKAAYERLITKLGAKGEVLLQEESPPSKTSTEKLFEQVIRNSYDPYVGTLKCGEDMTCAVTLCPAPESFREVRTTKSHPSMGNELILGNPCYDQQLNLDLGSRF